MKTKKLGSSDLEVPIVCMGTMTFGEQSSEEESFAIMDYALSQGVNFLDTAELYPVPPTKENNARTERIIGNWMQARGNRSQVIIATKVAGAMPGMDRSYIVANRADPPLDFETAPQPNLTREQILTACDASLRRLQTTYIDLYQIHWPARYAPLFGGRQYHPDRERDAPSIEEQVAAMGELIQAGKVKYWGLSNETTFGVCQFCETAKRLGVPLPVSIQNDFSPMLRVFEGDLAEACAPSNYNIGLLAYGVLAGGALSGKYLNGFDTSRSRHTLFPGFQPRYHAKRTSDAARELVEIAKAKDMSAATLCQAWAASRWYMGSVIIGATTLEQVQENIAACLTKLDEETVAAMDALFLKYGNTTLAD
uniref:NADP-dependent oxidoreductase domain-containing protein n=1 Tax=Tetradesmus obliquus TaxID=3088 RepID=A0A383W131_TETOB|eukprot:jgi/Sobl393_1/6296/SZX70803.1